MIVGALWWGYRRTRSRVGGRIKEVRSKAVDVMDHLDALKERLKLLPTSPEFREPMAGETAGALSIGQAEERQALGRLAANHGGSRQGPEAGGSVGLTVLARRRWPRPKS